MKSIFALSVLAVILAAPSVRAGVPSQVDAQGVLRDANGDLVDLDEATITFRLYEAESGGAPIWLESQDLPVVMGVFDTLLPADPLAGWTSAVATRLGIGAPLWLSIELDGQAELPRTPLVSVPFAFTADRALTAASLDCSGCIDAAAINTSTFRAQHLVYEPAGGDLIDATTVGGALRQMDDYFQDHLADPNAHHPADSNGIAIRPDSVQIGTTSTRLTEGKLDLGPGVADELTPAMIQTLTGGGNADALHTHTASSITGSLGGACTTVWGTSQCPSGYNSAYTGVPLVMANSIVTNGTSPSSLGSAPICSVKPAGWTYHNSYALYWVTPGAPEFGYQSATGYSYQRIECAMCCPAAASDASCTGNANFKYPYYYAYGTISTGAFTDTYFGNVVSTTSLTTKSKAFTLTGTYANRGYKITRIDVAIANSQLTGGYVTGATTAYDLYVYDEAGTTEIGHWPLVAEGTNLQHGVDVQSYNSNAYLYPVLTARPTLSYNGGTKLRFELRNVTTGLPANGLSGDYATAACTSNVCELVPWHRIEGCSL